MHRLHDFLPSGNGYKVRLLLSRLGIEFVRVDVDILSGESRTPEFLAKNPNGRVPVLELPDGRYLAESNAILWYLADGTDRLPEDRFELAAYPALRAWLARVAVQPRHIAITDCCGT